MAGGSKSKNKGGAGERELCKTLGGIFEGSFIRTNNSGAFIGGKNAFRKQSLSAGQTAALKGDIVPPDFLPRMVIECKSYADFRFHQLLRPGACTQLDTWIKQILDAVDPGDVWFVCFKINLIGWFVAVPENVSAGYVFDSHCRYISGYGPCIVTDLTSFFQKNKEAILRDAGKQI